ncbi:ATP-binding protein [Methanoregula sp. PtaB.Bin085]|uniref:ATP-binding protein n=1 Tax=Methanoregula sp. PtaB.Bin085 TaxID=1811680 RepID=UPI0009D200A6|nr:ATP-binding protein [Methanoregula sp. PtaB.Bin085]OPX64611.1 MAG: serine-protein kinase RsbW [Methanoregula sp. PtaB.Bin085]
MNPSFEITIGSEVGEIPGVSARLEEAMREYGFSPEDILDTQLAVEEVITNIIVHGYRSPGNTIHLTCRFTGDMAVITVMDSAPRFDPLSLPEPELDGNIDDRKIGGLGIYLVRQVMDSLSYTYENDKNILTLQKKKSS